MSLALRMEVVIEGFRGLLKSYSVLFGHKPSNPTDDERVIVSLTLKGRYWSVNAGLSAELGRQPRCASEPFRG